MADLSLTCHRIQLSHYHPHKSGLTFSVSAHQCDLFSPSDLNLSVVENHLCAIADSHVNTFISDISRARSWRELNAQSRTILDVHLDSFQLFKLLYSRLHLVGLCWLISELLDELFSLLDHSLLVLIGSLLLCKTLTTKLQVLAVRHFIVMNASHHDLHCAVGHVV